MANSLKLTLLRHGQTAAGSRYIGSTDASLTAKGWRQMTSAAQGRGGWQRVISSPKARCLRFAEQLAEQRSLPLEVVDQLAEYHFGDWENRTALAIWKQTPELLSNFWQDPLANPPPAGEPLDKFAKRIDSALEQLAARFSGEALLLVVHGGVIRYLLSRRDQAPLAQMLSYKVDHGTLYKMDWHTGLAWEGGQ